MTPNINHASMVHNYDLRCISDQGQAVSNYHHRSGMKVADNIIQYNVFIIAVERCGSFIEEEIPGITIDRSCDQYPLTFAFAKRKILVPYRCVDPLRKA